VRIGSFGLNLIDLISHSFPCVSGEPDFVDLFSTDSA